MARSLRPLSVLSLLAVLISGCAREVPAAPPSSVPSPIESIVIPIGPDGPELPEDVVAALQAYGAEHPDEFGGLYVEDQSRGAFGMFFTDRLEVHAAALAEIWPRVTVRAVRYSEAALMEVLERLDLAGMARPGLEPLSAGLDTMNNIVTLAIKSDDPTLEARLELQYGDMLEVTVSPLPDEWSNVAEGDGWRLLAVGDERSEAYIVRAARNALELDQLWAGIGLEGGRPAVDFVTEVVVSFGHGLSQSCSELRLDDVRIEGGVVYSVTSDPLAPRGCNLDLSAAAVFVVALDRSSLPGEQFTLQLDREGGPGCTECGITPILDVELP